VQLFVNPTRGSKDIERTRKRDRQTDGRTDTQTDNAAKNDMSPHFMGGDIIKFGLVLINFIQYYTIPNRAGHITYTVTVLLIFIIIILLFDLSESFQFRWCSHKLLTVTIPKTYLLGKCVK